MDPIAVPKPSDAVPTSMLAKENHMKRFSSIG